MEPWLECSGFPLVEIDQAGEIITITQKQLLIGSSLPSEKMWPIPLQAKPSLAPTLLSSATVKSTASEFVLLNKNSASFYVARYLQPAHKLFLVNSVLSGTLDAVDRLRLLSEASLLARAGVDDSVSSLQLLKGYSNENRDAIWHVMAQIIGDVRRMLEHDEALLALFKPYVADLITDQYERLGWQLKEHETEEEKKLRASIIGLAVWSEHADAKAHALKLFTSMENVEDIDAELRAIIYSAGAKWLGLEAYQKLFNIYQTTQFAEEKDNLVAGMTSTRDKDVIALLLHHLTNKEVVRSQDLHEWFIYLLRNVHSREEAWAWLTSHWDFIEKVFSGDQSHDSFPRYAGSILTGDLWLERFNTFFDPLKADVALTRNITIGAEDIATRTAWQHRDLEKVILFLNQE